MRVLVLGAGGQLGAAIVREFSVGHAVVPFDHGALDITDEDAVARAVEAAGADAIVNCAAHNAVDYLEDHPVEAFQVNAFAVRGLARVARARGAALVHYGTDFVFDGQARAPYREEERTNPKSVYAMSKLLGEWFAADAPRAHILRVESLFGRAPGGPPAKGSVAQIVAALKARRPTRVFEDRTISPTHIGDAARATRELLEHGAPPGLYHCVNSGSCTWLELASEAARLLHVSTPTFDVVKFSDVPLRAARPQFCALSNEKLATAGVAMPSWQDGLRRFLADDVAD